MKPSRLLPILAFLLPMAAQAAPIHQFARQGNVGLVRHLVESEPACANQPDAAGNTPLILGSGAGDFVMVRYLLGRHADPGARNGAGDTALLAAARSGHAGIVRILLEAGANPNDRNGAGENAAVLAGENGHGEVLDSLLSAPVLAEFTTADTARLTAALGPRIEEERKAGGTGADGPYARTGEAFGRIVQARAGESFLWSVMAKIYAGFWAMLGY